MRNVCMCVSSSGVDAKKKKQNEVFCVDRKKNQKLYFIAIKV